MAITTATDENAIALAVPRKAPGSQSNSTIAGLERDPWHRHERAPSRDSLGTVDPPDSYPRDEDVWLLRATGQLRAQGTHSFPEHLSVVDGSRLLQNHVIHLGHEPADAALTALHPEADALLGRALHTCLADLYMDFEKTVPQGRARELWSNALSGMAPTHNHGEDVVTSTGSVVPTLSGTAWYNQELARAFVRLLSYSQSSQRMDSRLIDALQDLREAPDEAEEEGFPKPSPAALANAERLLKATFAALPHRVEVYPTPDGEVAVHARVRRGSSVLMLCEPDGAVLCLVNMAGNHRRRRYENAADAPDAFLQEALAELGSTR